MRRRLGICAAMATCLAGLAGCGVPAGGALGVTVDAAGNPAIVVQMCEGHIDGATLYLPDPDPDREPPRDEDVGQWEVSPAVDGFSQFSFAEGGNGWRLVGTLKPRDLATRYTIYGWTKDNSWSAAHLDFSQQDLKTLKPGTVLVPEREQEGNRSESLEDFKTKTCEEWS
ncbi:hypothetical protein AB0E63_20310 [Kribbella sp. NPDC026596]|uniref:hypothetical protein n=1 Tax=Kribbella sp. NPDC026596 TaxID=3155122 RepID=UPI0033D7F83B